MSGIVRANNAGQSGAVSNIETIDSDDYVDASIDNAHLADDAVDSDELAAGAVDTAHIADNQVTLAKMAGGTDGQIITYDASGDPVAVGPGTDGQILTSTGAGSPPAFEDAAGGGPSQADQAALEAETNEDTYAPPDLLKYAPSAAKVWCMKSATGALNSPSHGVSSITDVGTGDATIIFSAAFTSCNYAAVNGMQGSQRIIHTDVNTTTRINIHSHNADSPFAAQDVLNWFVAFGDHA
jgi:hypothetical protein